MVAVSGGMGGGGFQDMVAVSGGTYKHGDDRHGLLSKHG